MVISRSTLVVRAAAILLAVALMACRGGSSSQKTLAPTGTASPTAPTATILSPLPTANSDSDAMLIEGDVWVDARPASGELLAFINGKQCGRGQSIRLPSEPPAP